MRGSIVGLIVAIFLDIILGVVMYSALSSTSMHPVATNLITISVMWAFLILELVILASNKGGKL